MAEQKHIRMVPNLGNAWQLPDKHGARYTRGGFKTAEYVIIGAMTLSPLLTGFWSFHHWILFPIMLALSLASVMALREVHKDGRELVTWARQTWRFFIHWKHPFRKRVIINGEETLRRPPVHSETIVTVPNPDYIWDPNQAA